MERSASLSLVGPSISESDEEDEAKSEMGSKQDESLASISCTLATLPSYIGMHEDRSEILPIPITSQPNVQKLSNFDGSELLQAPISITTTLEEILQFKPKLWDQIQTKLHRKKSKGLTKLPEPHIPFPSEPEQLCKVSQYVKTKMDKGNVTLKISVNDVTNEAILDTRAGISIITKETWETWDKRALRKTCLGLQLANGEIKYPMGLIDNMPMRVCGIKIEHTFAVVDFDQETNYEVILG